MKKLIVSIVLGVGVLLSSCIAEPPCPSQEAEESTASFILPQTRATDTNFSLGDEIGVYAVDGGVLEDHGNYADNKRYRYDGSRFFPVTSEDRIAVPRNAALKYFVYYPYKKDIGSPIAMKQAVSTDQGTDFTFSDWMYAGYQATKDQFVIPLTFYHRMSLIELTIENRYPQSGRFDLSKIEKVDVLDMKPGFIMNLENGEYETKGKREKITMLKYKETVRSVTFRVLLPTQSVNMCDIMFQIRDGQYKYYFDVCQDMTFVPGEKHAYTICTDHEPSSVAEL